MNTKYLRHIFIWILAILPLMILAVVYKDLPDQVPTHWNLDGSVTYGNKIVMWLISGLSVILAALFSILPKVDPRKRNYTKFQTSYDGFCIVLMLFLLTLNTVTISESFHPGRISVSTVIVISMGLLFIFIGNIMPKMKSNFFMGIKNPWTLSNDMVWNKTHRLAGRLWFIGGLIITIMPFFLSQSIMFIAFIVIILIIVFIPTLMSFLWFKDHLSNQ